MEIQFANLSEVFVIGVVKISHGTNDHRFSMRFLWWVNTFGAAFSLRSDLPSYFGDGPESRLRWSVWSCGGPAIKRSWRIEIDLGKCREWLDDISQHVERHAGADRQRRLLLRLADAGTQRMGTEAGFRVLAASAITDDPVAADKLVVAEIYRAMRLLLRDR